MKRNRVTWIICVWLVWVGQLVAQSVPVNDYLEMVASDDTEEVLKEMIIYPPVFCALHDGKRLKMKISNEGERVMRKTYFYLFYKKKRVCRIHLPNMKKGDVCEFGVNIHDMLSQKDRKELVFKLKKGRRYRTYKLSGY